MLDLYAVNDTYNIRMSKSCGGDKLNLEYLKNVVLRYMLSSDAGDREHMLKGGRANSEDSGMLGGIHM